MIDGRELPAILCRRLPVLYLRRHGRNTLFVDGGDFSG
jgi:hypothetical protein